jgi:hypothetical protein
VTAIADHAAGSLDMSESAADRDRRLSSETTKLRSSSGSSADRTFQLVGGVLLLLGLLAILAGWYGVSHTARTWRQTPYLVSGGFLGLALVFAGGFAYFSFWLTRLVEQTHRQTAVLERIERTLIGAGDDTDDERLVVAPPGVLHRAGCPLLLGKTDVRAFQSKRDAKAGACPVCEPPLP